MNRRRKFPDETQYSGELAFVPISNKLGGGYKSINMNNPDMYDDYLSDKLQIIDIEPAEESGTDSKKDKEIKAELNFDIDYKNILNEKPKRRSVKKDDSLLCNNNDISKNQEKNIHEKHRQRMKSRYKRFGLEVFEEHEVLEFLLFFIHKQKNTNPIAHALIKEFGSLENVLKADIFDLTSVKDVGNESALLINFCNQLCTYLGSHPRYNLPLASSSDMGHFCCKYFRQRTKETFIVLILDTKKNLRNVVPISEGTENETAYYPRNVVREALKHRANLVAIAHNHTGNSVDPSDNDIFITNKISNLLNNMGIPLIDHIICCEGEFSSFSDRRLLPE